MEIQLKELIETIKDEGIKSAENSAAEIIEKAKQEATLILEEAQTEASNLLKETQLQVEKERAASSAAIAQAARDLLLNLRKEIEKIFSALVHDQVSEALAGDLLKEAILAVMKGFAQDCSDMTLLVDGKRLAAIESALRSSLSNEIQKGLEIKPFDHLNAGFRLSMKNGTIFYDFSDREIATVLSEFLNKKLAATLTAQIQ